MPPSQGFWLMLSEVCPHPVCFWTILQTLCDLLQMSLTSTQLVQYIVVRGDLLRHLTWTTGAVITQACHASTAALWTFRNDPNTIQYTSELDHMHKVVLEVRAYLPLLPEVFLLSPCSSDHTDKRVCFYSNCGAVSVGSRNKSLVYQQQSNNNQYSSCALHFFFGGGGGGVGHLFEGGLLLTFPTFRMDAYLRWALF